jgi:hypothetical protein
MIHIARYFGEYRFVIRNRLAFQITPNIKFNAPNNNSEKAKIFITFSEQDYHITKDIKCSYHKLNL